MRQVQKGSTNVSVELYIIDNSDGTPELSVVYNTSGIDLNYRRDSAAVTAITEADLTTPALTDAHADGGFLHVSNGRYRLDVPDAAFATGVSQVTVGGTVTGMVVIPVQIQLVDFNPDATDQGLVLTNSNMAHVDSNEKIALLAATQTSIDAIETDTAAMQPLVTKIPLSDGTITWNTTALASVNAECDTALSDYDAPTKAEMDTAHGLLATEAKQDIIDANVDKIPLSDGTVTWNSTALASINAEADTALTDYDAPTKAEMDTAHALLATPAQVNTQCDLSLADINLDHLMKVAVTGADVIDDSVIAQMVSKSSTADWDDYVNTTESLQAMRDHIADGTNLTEAGGTGDHLTNITLANDLSATMKTSVQTAVDAAIDTAITELGVAQPSATPTLRTGLMLLYMALAQKLDVPTSGTDAMEIHNAAGTIIAKKLLTDSGGDYSEARMVSG